MYGYSVNTITYWGIEAVMTGIMAVLLMLGIWKKWRFIAYVYPAGQLLIRISALIFQPSDYGLEITLDKVAVLIGLCIFSALMAHKTFFGYATAFCSLWMLGLILPEGLEGLSTFFTFGGELIFLGLYVIFAAFLYASLFVAGLRFAGNKQHPRRKQTA